MRLLVKNNLWQNKPPLNFLKQSKFALLGMKLKKNGFFQIFFLLDNIFFCFFLKPLVFLQYQKLKTNGTTKHQHQQAIFLSIGKGLADAGYRNYKLCKTPIESLITQFNLDFSFEHCANLLKNGIAKAMHSTYCVNKFVLIAKNNVCSGL